MLRAFRSHSRISALLTAAVVAMVLFATCASAEMMTPEEKACCASMKHDCDMAVSMPCCGETPDHHSSTVAAKPAAPVAPAAALVAVLEAPALTLSTSSSHVTSSAAAASPPGVATYIFVSSFRI